MVSGGAEFPITPLGIAGFSVMRALSNRNDEPERASRPFDKDRDGFKLLLAAQLRWRKINAPHLVALVKASVEFPNGKAKMLQCEPEPEELFMPIPWILAADGVPIHNI